MFSIMWHYRALCLLVYKAFFPLHLFLFSFLPLSIIYLLTSPHILFNAHAILPSFPLHAIWSAGHELYRKKRCPIATDWSWRCPRESNFILISLTRHGEGWLPVYNGTTAISGNPTSHPDLYVNVNLAWSLLPIYASLGCVLMNVADSWTVAVIMHDYIDIYAARSFFVTHKRFITATGLVRDCQERTVR